MPLHRNDFFAGSVRAPEWSERVLSKFGRNRYGETLFRLIFLPSRCKIVGGFWTQDGELSYKLVPKYGKDEKWALERYVPASWLGTPEAWDALSSTIEGYYAIGPYPEHGAFECVAVFSTGKGPNGYVPLEASVVELQARAVWMGRMLTRSAIRAAAMGEEEEKIKKQDAYFDKLLAQNSFSRENAFGQAAVYNREQMIDDYKVKIIRSKAWQRKHRFGKNKGFFQYGAN